MSYATWYTLALINAAFLAVAGVLSVLGLLFHPLWMSNALLATAGILTFACGLLAAFLPSLLQTPSVRETQLLAALAGALPDDVAQKHGLSVVSSGGELTWISPEKPLDTL